MLNDGLIKIGKHVKFIMRRDHSYAPHQHTAYRRLSEVAQEDRDSVSIQMPQREDEDIFQTDDDAPRDAAATSAMVGPLVPKDFGIIKRLGTGCFGSVFLAKTQRSELPATVVLKQINIFPTRNRSTKSQKRKLLLLRRELGIHSRLDHPNIVGYHGFFLSTSHLSLVLERARYGDLHVLHEELIEPTEIKARIPIIRRILYQVVSALEYLHSLHIAHRDIKPENILVSSLEPLNILVCDFGWATMASTSRTLCGTVEFVPPEMLESSKSYRPIYVDRWALGVLAHELLYDETPFARSFSGPPTLTGMKQVLSEFRGISIQDAASEFVHCLLQPVPRQRMSSKEALAHGFLAEIR